MFKSKESLSGSKEVLRRGQMIVKLFMESAKKLNEFKVLLATMGPGEW